MAVTQSAVTVADSATVIAPVDATRRRFVIKNPGATVVYIGGSGVTTSNGFPLRQYDTFEVVQANASDTSAKQAVYGIVATGTQSVNLISVGD